MVDDLVQMFYRVKNEHPEMGRLIPTILLGTKLDLLHQEGPRRAVRASGSWIDGNLTLCRQVHQDAVEMLARRYRMPWIDISLSTGQGLRASLTELVRGLRRSESGLHRLSSSH